MEHGCAFVDYDRDGQLDLAVANYVDFKAQDSPPPRTSSGCNWKGMPVPCGPRGLKGESMTLYHNDGHGHFIDVTKQAGLETAHEYYGFTVLTGDFDNDGWPDIYVACDSTPSLYFHNKHDGTFEEMGLGSGLAVNEDGREQAGMGAAPPTTTATVVWTSTKLISPTIPIRSTETSRTTRSMT